MSIEHYSYPFILQKMNVIHFRMSTIEGYSWQLNLESKKLSRSG